MKITDAKVSQSSLASAQPAAPVASSADEASSVHAGAECDAYTPSAEWSRLIGLIQNEAEVRADRVLDVSQRLQSGAYLSPDSAEKTANAILSEWI